LKSDDVEALLGLGHCQVELDDYASAINTLNAVLRTDPERMLAHFYLSRAYAGLGNAAEAQHEAALHHLMMEQATFVRSAANEQHEIAIVAQARELLKDHRELDAVGLYRDHFKGTSATVGDPYVFIGKVELYMGDTENGLRNLHHALSIDPTVRGAHTYEGILDLKLGNLDAAESQFKAELANDPNYQTAIAELGEVRYHHQRWQEAADLLAKSKTMTPELIYMLCDSYFHLGDTQDADLNAETAAAYGRNNAPFMQGLIQLLRTNSQSSLADRLSAAINP
jgi:tetratricopeptide (TPR) repeat protein